MQRVTVTLDDDLVDEIDRLVAARGYQNRSEAIRDLARAGLAQMAQSTGSREACVGVLSYVYDHAARNLARRLTSVGIAVEEKGIAASSAGKVRAIRSRLAPPPRTAE